MGKSKKKKAQSAEEQRRNQLFALLMGEAQGIPVDLTESQREGIRRARLGGVDIGYQNLQDQATRRFSRTGSQAGYGELVKELGRERTREKSRGAAELEEAFAEVPVRRRLARARIFSPLYGASTDLYSRLLLNQGGPGTLERLLGIGGEIAGEAPWWAPA